MKSQACADCLAKYPDAEVCAHFYERLAAYMATWPKTEEEDQFPDIEPFV